MRVRQVGVLTLLTFGLAAVLALPAAAADFTCKFATANPPGSYHAICGEKFKELAEKYSGGKIEVKVYLGGQLGSEQDNVQACGTGMLHTSIMAVNNVTPFAPAVGFMTLPYIFPKIEDAYKLFKSPIMDDLNKTMVKQANVRALSWLVGGYRVLTNSKKEVRQPADLKGLTIRVPKNPIMIAAYKAWGINPVPMAWTEVFNALQQKVIDGQDNPHLVNADQKFFEVQKYITNIHYILWTGPLLASENWFSKLPKDMQEVVVKAAQEAAEYEWNWVAEKEAAALKLCLDKGMAMVEPADNEKDWIDKAKSVWPQFYESVGGKAAVDKVVETLSK